MYPIIVSLGLGYTYRLREGYVIAGIPAVISSIIQVESAKKRLSNGAEIGHNWRYSSMWAMHNWEYGYCLGEALTGLFLTLPSIIPTIP
ncbi:MAG: hypothetical protein QOF17_1216 [Solirubrobacteraceae bacterium]|jgi:hypothetical protein|nr:hypothetical protein [Solirubrobacteraceae bacterium]